MLLISLITAVQVILIIKIWMMTGDVRKIRQKLNEPQAENRKITEAQLKALEGKTEEAYTLYKDLSSTYKCNFLGADNKQ